jgi:hypothetical protein
MWNLRLGLPVTGVFQFSRRRKYVGDKKSIRRTSREKKNLTEIDVRACPVFSRPRVRSSECICEHGNEHSGPM